MKIIALPDLHENIGRLEKIGAELSQVDLVLLVGDLTNSGKTAEASRVVDAVRQYNRSILAVTGNWDTPEVEAYLTGHGLNLHRRNVIVDGIAFLGVGGSLPSPMNAPNEFSEVKFKEFLQEAAFGLEPSMPKILVAHQPPIETLVDKAWSDQRLGSRSVRAFIEEAQPVICFSGHIHEAVGMDTLGRTRLINPGPLSQGGYAYAEVDPKVATLEIRRG